MGKSLTEVAKDILMTEGQVPSMGTYDKNPERDVHSTTVNKSTLKPGSKYKEADPKKNEAEDLGGATPTSTAKENLGAKAAKVGKDSSKASKAPVGAEPAKKLSEDDEIEGKIVSEEEELDEELEAIVAEMVEAGLTEEEIEATIAEALAESDKETLEEDETELELSEELETFIAQKIEEGLSDEEIETAIQENFELVSEESEEENPVIELPKVDMTEHVNALLEGETLSEEFRAKATTIFESAVNAKLEEEIAILEDSYNKSLEEEVTKIYETLSEQVDDYLNYVVENWVTENEVAIEPALKTELTEEFISGLRNLFVEHYMNIPDEQVSVVEELGKKVEELETKLNEEIEQNVSLTKQLTEATRNEIVAEACEGLTDTQASKLESLIEGVDFTSGDEFAKKVATIKENYFPTKTRTSEPLDRAESNNDGKLMTEELQGPMAAYVKTIGKSLPK